MALTQVPAAQAGGMTLLSTTTMSGATVTLSSIPQTYNYLEIIVQDYVPVDNDSQLQIRINSDSGTKYRNSPFDAINMNTQVSFNLTAFNVSSYQQNSGSNAISRIIIPDYANTVTFKMIDVISYTNYTSGPNVLFYAAGGIFNSTAAVTSLDFITSSGNISSGTIKLYGVK